MQTAEPMTDAPKAFFANVAGQLGGDHTCGVGLHGGYEVVVTERKFTVAGVVPPSKLSLSGVLNPFFNRSIHADSQSLDGFLGLDKVDQFLL